MVNVKIKKLVPEAVIPSYASDGDAGMDLVAVSAAINPDGFFIEYGTGLAIEIPDGYVGLIYPRSSISKTSLRLANCVGVIDSGYRGEVKLRFKDSSLFKSGSSGIWYGGETSYEVGDRIGQLIIMPYPKVQFTEVDELQQTRRGEGGFGSTGN